MIPSISCSVFTFSRQFGKSPRLDGKQGRDIVVTTSCSSRIHTSQSSAIREATLALCIRSRHTLARLFHVGCFWHLCSIFALSVHFHDFSPFDWPKMCNVFPDYFQKNAAFLKQTSAVKAMRWTNYFSPFVEWFDIPLESNSLQTGIYRHRVEGLIHN